MGISLEDLLKTKFETLPQIGFSVRVSRAMALLDEPDVEFAPIAAILAKSKKVADRIVVNASTLSKGEVTDLAEALRYLGVNSIKTFLTANFGADFRLRNLPSGLGAFLAGSAWAHAQQVAICSQFLAEESDYPNLPQAFTAGLLHDVGEPLAATYPFKKLASTLSLDVETATTPMTLDDRTLGYNHAYLSSAIADYWSLPPAIISTLRYHHQPAEATVGKRLAGLVHLADVAIHCQQRNLPIGISLFPVDKAVMAEAGFTANELKLYAQKSLEAYETVERRRQTRELKL